MSNYGPDMTFLASEDLTGKQYHLVKLVTAGTVELCDTAGEKAVGVLQNECVSGGNAVVRVIGPTKLKVGGTVAAMGYIQADSDAMGIAAAAADEQLGIFCEAGADGDIINAIFNPNGLGV